MKFLNQIDGAKDLVQDSNNRLVTDAEKTAWNEKDQIPLVIGTQTATTASWTGVASTVDSLYNGLTIRYWLPQTSASNVTLNLTLKGGGTTGAINCYYRGSSRLTTHYTAGNLIIMTYLVNALIGSTQYTGWWAHSQYVDGTESYAVRWNAAVKVGVEVTQYKLLVQGVDGKYYPTLIGNTTAGTKTVNTVPFLIGAPIIFYGTTATVAANALTSTAYNYTAITTSSTAYAFNQTSGFLANADLYLKGTIVGATFILDNTTLTSHLTQTLPTTEDGFFYLRLGISTNTTTGFRLTLQHPIYYFADGQLQSLDSSQIADWDHILNKPTVFPPDTHTHLKAQVTDLGNLAGISTNASTSNYLRGDGTWVTPPNTVYTHPANHPASVITQDASNRFVTDAEKTAWNAKGTSNLALGTTSSTAYRGDYGNTAYTHSQSAHAPSGAQVNQTLTSGNGMAAWTATNGNLTILLGTPSTLTTATTNAVTTTSHTHSVTFPVTSVAGKTGAVTLGPTDVGAAASTHSHGTYDRVTAALTGANVFSDLVVEDGIVTGISTRALTLANLGYTGATNANYYTHPSTDGNLHVPATSTTNNGKVLKAGATAGSLSWGTLTAADVGASATGHTHTKANITDLGTIGTVAALNTNASTSNYLRGDGTWVTPPNTVYTHPSTDGSLHVPATGTTNNGKVLKAGATAGTFAWGTLTATDVGAAATSHGNHVPTTETANNAIFLRNDNTWQTVTPANIGAATSDHTHDYVPTTRTVNSKALSANISLTAADVGAAATSHGNHVPTTGTANNAIFLRNDNTWQTVTPANIGAAASSHTHSYVPTTRTVNSKALSANIALTAADVGASATGHTHSYLPLSGGTVTGTVQVDKAGAFNTTTPGKGLYGLHFAQHSADQAAGITWSGDTTGAQAGIYVQASGAYGTRMYFATTNAYVTGAQTALFIDTTGAADFKRARPTALGNTILDAGNYSTYCAAKSHTHAYVPTTRTVNSKALSANISLTAADVGAAVTAHKHTATLLRSAIQVAANSSITFTDSGNHGLYIVSIRWSTDLWLPVTVPADGTKYGHPWFNDLMPFTLSKSGTTLTLTRVGGTAQYYMVHGLT